VSTRRSPADLDRRRRPRPREDGHGAGGGVDAALGLGLRDALHAVRAGLELQARVDVAPSMRTMTSLKPPCSPGARDMHLVRQPRARRSAGTCATGRRRTSPPRRRRCRRGSRGRRCGIAGIAGQQQHLQLSLQFRETRLALVELPLRHLAHLRVVVLEHGAGRVEILALAFEFTVTGDHRLELGVLAGQVAEALLVADHLGITEQRRNLLVTLAERLQLRQQ
jgi:hypothetical protein